MDCGLRAWPCVTTWHRSTVRCACVRTAFWVSAVGLWLITRAAMLADEAIVRREALVWDPSEDRRITNELRAALG